MKEKGRTLIWKVKFLAVSEACGSTPTPGLELCGFMLSSKIRALWIVTNSRITALLIQSQTHL